MGASDLVGWSVENRTKVLCAQQPFVSAEGISGETERPQNVSLTP